MLEPRKLICVAVLTFWNMSAPTFIRIRHQTELLCFESVTQFIVYFVGKIYFEKCLFEPKMVEISEGGDLRGSVEAANKKNFLCRDTHNMSLFRNQTVFANSFCNSLYSNFP